MQFIYNYKNTIIITILNVVFFFLFMMLSRVDVKIPLYFSVWKYETGLFAPYQLISYQFIHANLSHLILNLLIFIPTSIYLENSIKSLRLFYYFLISGIIGGCFHLLLYQSELPLVGSSGSIWGLSILLALKTKSDYLRYFIYLSFVLEVYRSFSFEDDGIAHFCHVGGAVAGFLIYFLDRKSTQTSIHTQSL